VAPHGLLWERDAMIKGLQTYIASLTIPPVAKSRATCQGLELFSALTASEQHKTTLQRGD